MTERLKLVRRYEALIGVQGETLEALAEGVAVFGSDGRLDLHNPAFARQWRLEPDGAQRREQGERPHIETVLALVPAAVRRRRVLGAAARRRHRAGTAASRSRRGSNGSTAACSIAPPCRCPTAPRW